MDPKPQPSFWRICLVRSVFAVPSPSYAQPTRKTLTYAGFVTDEAGLPIADVEVRATALEEGGKPQTTVTDHEGRFMLSGVPQFHHDRTSRYLVCATAAMKLRYCQPRI